MCPRKQTTEPKLLILVSFFSGEVTSYTNTNYCILIILEVCRSVFYGPPCIDLTVRKLHHETDLFLLNTMWCSKRKQLNYEVSFKKYVFCLGNFQECFYSQQISSVKGMMVRKLPNKLHWILYISKAHFRFVFGKKICRSIITNLSIFLE